MKVGAALLATINRAEQLLERMDLPPEAVGPVVQERRFRDTFSDGRNVFDSIFQSKDFQQRFEEVVTGQSFRAGEAQKVTEQYQALRNQDTFRAFKPSPVALTTPMKASDLTRVFIRC